MLEKSSSGDVVFIYEGENKDQVFLVGDFNNWSKTSHKLSGVKGKLQIKLKLKPGKYAYKYLVNGNWTNDSAADEYRTNPFGEQDSVLVVSEFKQAEKSAAKKTGTVKARAKKK